MTDTVIAPTHPAQARALIGCLAADQPVLYPPNVLDRAAELLAQMWAVEEHTGARFEPQTLLTNFPVAALDAAVSEYTGRNQVQERTPEDIEALETELFELLGELGVKADRSSSGFIRVRRTPSTPAGDDDGFLLGFYSDAGWFLETSLPDDPSVPVIAPATPVGAAQVAAVIRAFVNGQLGNPFSR
jgi:hypothetical protein